MGLFKTVGKTIGTTILTATGVTSTVLKTCSDHVGFELGSEIFGSAKDASFNGIKKMWSSKKADNFAEKTESLSRLEALRNARDGYLNKANAAKQIAEMAEQNGNERKQREYEAEYNRCMNKYRSLDIQYREAIKQKIERG